ncbi:MAG: hypothetical protein KME22_11475, partial [Hassallia sp. WJT32-NPBG1]|nr:hypothetical protein [Hassallia sp. WJT32-NPBG1]
GNGKTNYRPKCSSKSGEGFGFRGEYSNALNSPKLRAHPNSAPQPKTDFSLDDDGNFIDPGFDYRSAGAFWDEAGTLIEFKNLIEVTLKDLEKIYCKVPTLLSACLLDEFKHDLDPLWQVLMGLLDPSFRGYIPDSERFGMNNRDIRALLPLRPENINKIIEFLKTELAPDLSFLQEKGDGIDFKSVLREDRRSAALANLALNAQDSRQKAQKLEDLMLNWFVPFLEAWRDNSGYFKRDFGTVLKIYSPSDRHTDVASSMKWNIYLDATLSPQMLGDILGTEDILHIKQQMPSYQNLRMIQVTGMGTLSSDRRESASLRVQAVLTELQTRHPDLAVIDWKSKATSGQGYHFRDGRGVNRFALASALAIVGTPCPNIGALAINYQLLKNKPVVEDSSEFRAFVDEHIQAELVQEAGRLRANLRPDEQLTLYFCGDYALDFIKDHLPGVQMEQLDAFRISPDAGDRCQRTKYRILKVFAELIDAGEDSAKITQEQIAVKAEIARSRISQIASVFGGWATLRKLLVLLCKTLYNKTNNSENPPQPGEELNSDLLWMANDYLPLLATNLEELPPMEVVEEILHIIKAEGWHRFKAVLKLTDTTSKMAILGYLISLFPSIWREEFT